MPILTVNTNVPKEKIPNDLATTLVQTVAKALGKPANFVVVQINAGANLCWGGSNDSAAISTLASIGQIGRDENKQTSRLLMEAIEKGLSVPPSHQYISFVNMDKQNVGFNGTTFDDLL